MIAESFELVTGPADEPVSLEEIKQHARIDDTNSDAGVLRDLIAAREHLERTYARMLMPQTWDYQLDRFPSEIRIPRAPIASITSIKYIDGDGVEQTITSTDYQTDLTTEPTRIKPAFGLTWPTARLQYNSIKVRFVGGYDSINKIPQDIKHAVLLLATHWIENRELVQIGGNVTQLPFTVRALMAPYEIFAIS